MSIKSDADKMNKRREYMLTSPLFPLLVKMSIPTIIGMFVFIIYNLTDTFFVGLLHNQSMTASMGVVFSFTGVIQAVGFLFGYGSGNTMAKKLGENNRQEAEIISSTGVALSAAAGFAITFFSWIFIHDLIRLTGGAASVSLYHFTMKYLRIIIACTPFSIYSSVLYNQLRLCGNAKDAMKGMMSGMVCNMILDPILMFGTELRFEGAGYATLAGQVAGSIVLTVLAGKNGNIAPSFRQIVINKDRVYHIFAGGMPNFLRQAVTGGALVLMNVKAAKYGDGLIAALTVSSKAAAAVYLVMIGWGQGFQSVCAVNYGAEQYGRVKSAFRLAVFSGTVFLTVSAAVLYLFPEPFISLMSRDREVVAEAVVILKIQCFTMPALAYFAISSMLMQNMGQYARSSIISAARQGICYIPLLYVLPHMFGRSGIYMVQPASDILSFFLAAAVIRNCHIFK